MAKTILIILIAVPTFLFSQKKKNYISSYLTVELFGGTNFHTNKPAIVSQTNYAGLGFQYFWPMDPRHLGFYRIDMRYTIPINYKANDSLNSKLKALMGSFSFGAVYFQRTHFSLPVSLGLNFGQAQLKTNDKIFYKNNSIAPKITIQPKLTFGRVYFAPGLEYCYDLSKPIWKSSKGNTAISSFNQSSVSVYFSIGFRFI